MNFLLITGPPAVGKMTVGQHLAKKLDYKLFHNHHSIDLTLNFFQWGAAEFKQINEGIRQLIFKTVAESTQLKGFIFTLVWAFDHQSDWDYVQDLKRRFE
ncbi:MAG: AAA family ATPase [Bacteroidota bacterium]